MKRLLFTLSFVAVFVTSSISARVKLPSVFSNNMVLQQKCDVAFWGKAEPEKRVVIRASWNKSRTVVYAGKDSIWRAKISTPAAGGPFTISFDDGDKVTLKNVLCGEVWFCSGQSNMEMPVKGFTGQMVEGSVDAIISAQPSIPIRMCTVKNNVSATPLFDCKAVWMEHNHDGVANCSATAYFFAQYLHEALNVPVGLIISDWGGTPIESWIDRQTLESGFPDINLDHLSAERLPEKSQYLGATLFNGMVHPVIPFTIRGWIWYQGESNRGAEDMYRRLQPAYASMMRRYWNNDSMPFYFVQIAPYAFQGRPDGETASRLMEAQWKSMEDIPHCGMATTLDIGDEFCIHPPKKREVGQRLALMALKDVYDIDLPFAHAPTFKSFYVKDDTVIVSFHDCYGGIGPINRDIGGFELAGEDRVFYPAIARVCKDRVTISVTSENVPHPIAVRYAFHNYAPATLFNLVGIPVAPFRSDDWPREP